MADSKIEWTDKAWNPVRGCSIVSAGCKNCYAMKQAHRFSGVEQPYEGLTQLSKNGPVWTGSARFVPEMLAAPMSWKKPQRIFVNSMSDLFHSDITNEQIAAVFGVMAACPRHTFQVLTKRPERMLEWFQWLQDRGGLGPYIRSIKVGGDRTLPDLFHAVARTAVVHGKRVRSMSDPWIEVFNAAACIGGGPLSNVWLGVSCENQAAANARIPLLLQCPAAVHWVSAEPLLGPVDFTQINDGSWYDREGAQLYNALNGTAYWRSGDHGLSGGPKLSWIVAGGESGTGSRPCDVSWIESIVTDCEAYRTPMFVKQLGRRPYDSRYRYGVYAPHDKRTPTGPDGAGGVMAIGNLMVLKDRKGGDLGEMPPDLRVRQFPGVANG